MPQYAAGMRIEPPVSVPSAKSQTPAATSAAEPLLEPPDVRLASSGLNVMPYAGLTLPAAYSRRFVLQRSSAPAVRRRATTARRAPAGGGTPTVDAFVVTTPRTSMLSLTATGTPCSGPSTLSSPGSSVVITALSRGPSVSSRA